MTAMDSKPVATAWLLNGKMVNAFPRPPYSAEDWARHDYYGYWSDKGYSEAPLFAAPPSDTALLRQCLEALRAAEGFTPSTSMARELGDAAIDAARQALEKP